MKSESVLKAIAEIEAAFVEGNVIRFNTIITKTRQAAEKELSMEIANAKGGNDEKQRLRAAIKLIKGVDDYRVMMKGAWDTEQGQNLCDGFRCVTLTDKIAGVPYVTANGEPLDLEKIYCQYGDKLERVEWFPEFKSLELQYKTQAAQDKKHNYVDIGDRRFNLEYLVDVLTLLGRDGVEVYQHKESNSMSPFEFKSSKGKGLLLPVRK